MALGAGTTTLVGCSSEANNAKEQAKTPNAAEKQGRWSWSIAPAAIADGDIAQTLDCDVLILGAGSAGVPAAYYASEQGARTIVMQKYEKAQSNGWSIGAFNTKHDSEFGIEYNPAEIRTKMAFYTNGRANINLICTIIDKSGNALDWIADKMEDEKPVMMVSDATETRDGNPTHLIYFWVNGEDMSTRYDAFAEAIDIMVSRAEKNGTQFLYSTPAVQLVTDDSGKVTGAVGLGPDGYVKVNASKGVLLATGDISDDDEMLECYCPTQLGIPRLSPYGTCTGDGHKMALWAGAKMDRAPFCLGMTVSYNGDGVGAFYSQTWLRVNVNGERFTNEDIVNHPINDFQPMATADSLQPEHIGIQILDSNFTEDIDIDAFMQLVENGEILHADTIEELAERAGIEPNALVKTVERYNNLAENGEDTDFGASAETLQRNAVKEAPFYAIKQPVGQMSTIGGVCTNDRLEVIDEKGRVINGLYAAGNLLGGCYGYEYPWVEFAATNKMHAMAGGMIAIKSMLGTFDEEF